MPKTVTPIYFYPRSPCGERRYWVFSALAPKHFYPRSPCGERHECTSFAPKPKTFLSTLSLRRATARRASRQHPAGISIHALLAESDKTDRSTTIPYFNFYPRSPCGERHILCVVSVQVGRFLSTLSLRRATLRKVPILGIK